MLYIRDLISKIHFGTKLLLSPHATLLSPLPYSSDLPLLAKNFQVTVDPPTTNDFLSSSPLVKPLSRPASSHKAASHNSLFFPSFFFLVSSYSQPSPLPLSSMQDHHWFVTFLSFLWAFRVQPRLALTSQPVIPVLLIKGKIVILKLSKKIFEVNFCVSRFTWLFCQF